MHIVLPPVLTAAEKEIIKKFGKIKKYK